jgi:hypothetical protein
VKDVSAILDLIGDDSSVCAALRKEGYELKDYVPRDWRRRDSIPAGFWLPLSNACPSISLEHLAELHRKPTPSKADAA